MSDVSSLETGPRAGPGRRPVSQRRRSSFSRWMSVLQNSKEEALNNAFKGDDTPGENNIVQELTKEIICEVQRVPGNDVCCDCGAPGDPRPRATQTPLPGAPSHFRHKVRAARPELRQLNAVPLRRGGGGTGRWRPCCSDLKAPEKCKQERRARADGPSGHCIGSRGCGFSGT